jgi:TRAP-type C4-dicarboxylate transport system permease small subunit
MADNPYAPPSAVVADIPAPDAPARPWEVRLAVCLLGIALVAQVPEAIAALYSETPVFSHDSSAMGFIVAATLAGFAVFGAMIYCVWLGFRWARIVYSALTVLGWLSILSEGGEAFAQGLWSGLFYLTYAACDVIGVLLLFLPASNTWFRTARAHYAR